MCLLLFAFEATYRTSVVLALQRLKALQPYSNPSVAFTPLPPIEIANTPV